MNFNEVVNMFADGNLAFCINEVMRVDGYGSFDNLESISIFLDNLNITTRNDILERAVALLESRIATIN